MFDKVEKKIAKTEKNIKNVAKRIPDGKTC